jgi:hypothetical protein
MDGYSSRRRFLKETPFGVIALAAAKIISYGRPLAAEFN